MDYRKYITNVINNGIYPTFKGLFDNLSDKIVLAINNKPLPKELSINNPKDISDPIVAAQIATTDAIKAIPVVSIPELDISGLETKLDALLTALRDKDMVVNVGKTEVNVDNDKVVKAIEKIKLEVPKMEKQEVIDYTLMFDEMMTIMERPQDTVELVKIQELIKKISITEELNVLAEYLQLLIDKPYPIFPDFPRDKDGVPYFTPTKTGGGGGGGGLSQAESLAIQGAATEETLQAVLEAVDGLEVSVGDVDVNTDGIEALQTTTNTKLDTLNAKDFSTSAKQDTQIVTIQDLDNKLSFLLDRLDYGTITDKTKTLRVQLNPDLVHNIGTVTGVTTVASVTNSVRQGDLQTQRLNEAILDASFINGITNNLAF